MDEWLVEDIKSCRNLCDIILILLEQGRGDLLATPLEILFEKIRHLIDNQKRDRAFRFVALIFMNHFREVDLIQYGDKLMVEKIETDSQR